MKKLKAAIIGFGGMGHMHASRYKDLKNVELVAICDIDPKKLETDETSLNLGKTGKVNSAALRKYKCYEDLVKGEKGVVDILDICLPAYLHAEYDVKALRDGFHVISEKPMALNTRDCVKIMNAVKKYGRKFMVAQCLRFSTEYGYLAKLITDGTYGKLQRLDMLRYSSYPTGASNWYMDAKLSGGAVIDLHLHDLDWVQSYFGVPKTIQCFGVQGKSGGLDEVNSVFGYGPKGPVVTAMGSWMRACKFRMAFVAIFEKAVLHFEGGELSLTDNFGKEKKINVKHSDMYGNEIEYFADCVLKNKDPEKCLPGSTANTVKLVELERKSAKLAGKALDPAKFR